VIALPRFRYGTLEAIKWLALALMVLDHVDAFVFHRELTWACALGRLVFPLFAFVLGYHMSRADALRSGVYPRVLSRLLLFGAVAQVPHGLLTHAAFGLFPLNVLATFAVAVGVMWLWEVGLQVGALFVFVALSPLVEYGYPGVATCLTVWWLYRWPSTVAAVAMLFAWASLVFINGSQLAIWAIPLLLLASRLDVMVPRLRWAFYGFYPAHLIAFVLLQ
jgi:hypothetical protein